MTQRQMRQPRPLALGHRGDCCDASARQQRSESRRCIASHSLRYVPIELESGLYVVMPESLAHGLDIDTCLEQERGMGMTEAVERNRRQAAQIADAAHEAASNDIRVLRRASRPTEDKI